MIEETIRIAQIMGKWNGGGVESVVMNYYRHIDRNKIQFDFVCDNDSTDIPYKEIEELGGKVILIPPYQKIFKYHKELKKVLENGNYKIVHSHLNALSVFSLYAAKCAGIPIRIAHSHSTTNKVEWKKNFIKQILRPFAKAFATDYMCCSELAGRWLFGNREYDSGNVYLLNNAIDLEKFKYDENTRNKIRKSLNIKENDFVIGHIGRFVGQKNHSFLIDIFKKISNKKVNSKLILIGHGKLENTIKEKVKMLNLTSKVEFVGQVLNTNEMYQAFDAFVLPSLYEGLPVVGIEAQASGVSCFFSDNITSEAKILENVFFLSNKESPEVWANCIISKSKKKREDTISEMTKRNFNINVEAKKLEFEYMNLKNNKEE